MNIFRHKLLSQSAVAGMIVVMALCVELTYSAHSGQDAHQTNGESVASVRETLEPNSVIAIVDGVAIPYKAIEVHPEAAESEPNAEIAANRIMEEERSRLAARIREIILNRKLRELHITASPDEIETKVKQTFEKSGITPQDVAGMRKQLQTLRGALIEWQRNPSAAEDIYKKQLEPLGISPEQWRLFRFSYDTPEKLQKLTIPKDMEEMKANSRQSARMDVLHEKLDKLIVGNVSVSNEEVRGAYQAKYDNMPGAPSFEDAKDAIQTHLLDMKRRQARALWWREQYKSANIRIKIPAYEDVVKRLFRSTELDSLSHGEQRQAER